MRKQWITLNVIFLLILGGVVDSSPAWAEMQVFYFDVGQAESTLLWGEDFAILIDAGDRYKTDVIDHLKGHNLKKVDLLILTHPHADHIGQAAAVLETFAVDELWMPGYEHTTLLYEQLLDTILDSDVDYYEPKTGEIFDFGQLTLEILNPVEVSNNIHDSGLVVRAVYGEISFLFTGDAERRTENRLLSQRLPIEAQILQLGHHGSRTSSTLDFLLAVRPEVAIYSAGLLNDYGHPHEEVINRLKILEVPIYGTDQHGTIVVKTDGNKYNIACVKGGGEESLKNNLQ